MDLAHWEAVLFGLGGLILVVLLCYDNGKKKRRTAERRRRRRKGYDHSSDEYESESDDVHLQQSWGSKNRRNKTTRQGSDTNETGSTRSDDLNSSGRFSWDELGDSAPSPKRSSYFGLPSSLRGGIRVRTMSSAYNSGAEDDPIQRGRGSPDKSNSNAALDLFFTSADFENTKSIDQKASVKKGLLITLGGKKMMEKSPTVKQRMFFLRGYYLSYTDSYGMKKELDLRWCQLSKHQVTGTSGVGDGQSFFAISFEANGGNLLLGASSQSYRDEWYDTLTSQIERIRMEDIDAEGEHDETRFRGIASHAEASLLAPSMPKSVKNAKNAMKTVRNRLSSVSKDVDQNDIISPLHSSS